MGVGYYPRQPGDLRSAPIVRLARPKVRKRSGVWSVHVAFGPPYGGGTTYWCSSWDEAIQIAEQRCAR